MSCQLKRLFYHLHLHELMVFAGSVLYLIISSSCSHTYILIELCRLCKKKSVYGSPKSKLKPFSKYSQNCRIGSTKYCLTGNIRLTTVVCCTATHFC